MWKTDLNESKDPAVRLRPFPYPYRAGLAISSDIDRCDRDTFIRVHRYLNCPEKGLGLPVADSFFGVGRQCGHMSYFLDDGKTPSADAELIQAGLSTGLIDTIHSWGAFDRTPPQAGHLRRCAENLTEAMDHHGLKVGIWSDHGAPINCHNLYVRTMPSFSGDDPRSPFYTGDLVKHLGITFYWGSELLPWPLSTRSGKECTAVGFRLLGNTVKNMLKRCLGKAAHVRPGRQILDLAYPVALRDGRILYGFNRYNQHPEGLWGIPTRRTLRYGLDRRILDKLVRCQGFLIVYTHLGMPWGPGEVLFEESDEQALKQLAEYFRNGAIWVARTADLLTYWRISRGLQWSVDASGEEIHIRIHRVADPATGMWQPEASDLAGLCFYTPRPEHSKIFLEDIQLHGVVNSADATGMGSVGLAVPDAPDVSFLKDFALSG